MQVKKLRAIRKAVEALSILDAEKKQRVVFTTQNDNRVDDRICLELSGIAFDIDDPLRPIIPQDTHPRCRCYYTDEETGAIITDISSRRSTRERNKLTNRQRLNQNKRDKQYLTQYKMDLIVETMEENEAWQKKIPDFPFKDASVEKITRWITML